MKVRITKDTYGRYTVDKYIEPTRNWFFFVKKGNWEGVVRTDKIELAQQYARQLEKYGQYDVIYQSDLDQLDLGEALE